jgi:hypothetical protein
LLLTRASGKSTSALNKSSPPRFCGSNHKHIIHIASSKGERAKEEEEEEEEEEGEEEEDIAAKGRRRHSSEIRESIRD